MSRLNLERTARKTAVGWILRDIAARDEDAAMAFIDEHVGHFSVEALRNAPKHAGASRV